MQRSFKCLMVAAVCAISLQACSAPPPDATIPGHAARQMASQRMTAVIVTNRNSIAGRVGNQFTIINAMGDADGGSATPITADGYFLTADHVLAQSAGRQVFIVYRNGGNVRTSKARVVWRSSAGDLALLQTNLSTPYYYPWSPPEGWLPIGTPLIHAGIATGSRTEPGKLSTDLPPETPFTGTRKFKIDMPLQPGDSGGPVITARGELVGINSAVEFLVPMETAFFIDSECNRPNVRTLEALIERDRKRHPGRSRSN